MSNLELEIKLVFVTIADRAAELDSIDSPDFGSRWSNGFLETQSPLEVEKPRRRPVGSHTDESLYETFLSTLAYKRWFVYIIKYFFGGRSR